MIIHIVPKKPRRGLISITPHSRVGLKIKISLIASRRDALLAVWIKWLNKMLFFDMYRRGQSSEVQHKVSLVLCSTPVSAKCSARRGQPQLQWQCEQRGLQRQLLVVHAQCFRLRLGHLLLFGRSGHEQQQSVQRAIRAPRPSLYQQDGHTPN